MFGKRKGWAVIALAAILSLVLTTAAFAQTGGGAAGQGAGWHTIGPGQQIWYSFHSNGAGSDATDAAITVQLASDPQGAVGFDVWTPTILQTSYTDDTVKALGKGTLHPKTDGDTTYDEFGGNLVWVGDSKSSGDYMIAVTNNSKGNANYRLNVAGNYLTFPSGQNGGAGAFGSTNNIISTSAQMGSGASMAQNPPETLPSTGQSSAPAQAPGASPFNALNPSTNAAHTLAQGQSQWFAFNYAGPDADDNKPMVSIVLNASPQNSATFSVWTTEGIQAWVHGDTDLGKPVGRGTLHQVTDGDTTYDRFSNNLQWNGAFGSRGTYYVRVDQTGATPATYSLQFNQQ